MLNISGYELRISGVRQMARSMPAGKGPARKCNNRHTHPERFAGRHAARIRLWIERQIDAVVCSKQILMRRASLDHDPTRFNAPRLKRLAQSLLRQRIIQSVELEYQC